MIYVKKCGRDSHHRQPCAIDHGAGINNYLILLVKKAAWFYIDGKKIETIPNMVILFPPHSPIHYGCDLPGYNDDWIHFTFNGNNLLDRLTIPENQPIYVRDFHRLSQYVQFITDSAHLPITHQEEIVDALMTSFLYALDDEVLQLSRASSTHKYYRDFTLLRTQLYNNPSDYWSVARMADSLHLSTSYFQHLYKQFFSHSCRQDIIQARIDYARFYLANSEMSIHNLAEFCGYETEVHFMRQFKKIVGQTPSEYRKNHT